MQRDECDKQIFENKVQGNLCVSGEQVPLSGDTAHLRATCGGSSSGALWCGELGVPSPSPAQGCRSLLWKSCCTPQFLSWKTSFL